MTENHSKKGKGPVIRRRPEREVAPLSYTQHQMWLMDQVRPGNPAYNLPMGYRLQGRLDRRALEASCNAVIARHEGLRTSFAMQAGEPVQRIHPECRIQLRVRELDRLPEAERERRLHALASADAGTSFDLTRLPLLRVTLFKLTETDHVLLVNFHHIVADGLSLGLFLDELDAGYRAYTGGEGAPLVDLPVQYGDFAQWQREVVATRDYTTQLAFWQERLQGPLPVLDVPTDLPRPALQSFQGSNVFFEIPPALAQAVAALGAREGCTPFTTLLAALQVLLYRYSGADDLLIGTPLAVRTPREVEPLIGPLLNMVALRCDLSGQPTFLQVLRRTRRTTLKAFAKDVPFEVMVEHLTFERDPSRNPIFQVMLEVMPGSKLRLGDLAVNNFYFDLPFALFDLSLHVCEEADGYVCRFEYCTDLFQADTIERLKASLVQLLTEVTANPEQKISQIPISAPAERERVLVEWNATARGYARERSLHAWVEETAAAAPERVAIRSADRTLSYGEMNAQANRVAHALRAAGVGPEQLVGLYLERSPDLVVGLLGILKAGAAYVPMDPAFPPDRLTYMLEDAGIMVLVTQTALQATWPPSVRTVLCLDAEAQLPADTSNPQQPVAAEQLAYVIYTSGSTGKPKGVMIEHRAVVNFLTAMQRRPGLTADDVLVAVTTISFDIAVLEILLPLVTGGTLVLASRDEVVDGRRLRQLLQQHGATILQATPATWKLLLDAGWTGGPGLAMLCGGEALPRELATRLLEGGGPLWNMYGPTETTIWSSVHPVAPGTGPVLIGPPIANTQFYIVDPDLAPVPIGVPGELVIGGDGVARGYLHRPALTAERFVTLPVGSRPRVYKTGDRARFRPDGTVEFLGRLDFQVKVRGYRIELGEIEQVLAQHPGVQEAVVLTWTQDDDTRLVAYYRAAAETPPPASDLRAFVRQQLPEYMCPAFFVALAAFPLTPNGKVDRRAFPAPPLDRADLAPAAAPQTALEAQLVALWQRALKRQPIAVTDNFFELGGHSLLAAHLFAQIEQQLGVTLPLATLFHAPTIRQLAQHLDQYSSKSHWNSLVPIRPQGHRPPLFLIHGAEGNLLLYRNLSLKLSMDQPIYGLQSRGLDGRQPVESTIESMAARYCEEIVSAQPSGPVYLAGYCLGGTIAFEVARQLKAAGRSIGLLAMIESYNLHDAPRASFTLRTFHAAENLYFQARNVALSFSGGTSRFLAEKLRTELGRLRIKGYILWATIVKRVIPGRGLTYQHLKIQGVNDAAQATYRPAPYDGEVVLFRPRVHFRRFNDWDFGWGKAAKRGVKVVKMPNYPRGSLNSPFVEVLAAALEEEIGNTLETSPSRISATKGAS